MSFPENLKILVNVGGSWAVELVGAARVLPSWTEEILWLYGEEEVGKFFFLFGAGPVLGLI